jgi:hypothetical protein
VNVGGLTVFAPPELADVLTRLQPRGFEPLNPPDVVEFCTTITEGRLRELMVDFIGGTNVPISLVENPRFRSFIQQTARNGKVPSRHTIRKEILQAAKQFRESRTPTVEGSQYASLMIDGAFTAQRNWMGISLRTRRHCYAWTVVQVPNQTALTTADVLTDTILALREQGFRICAIANDNASAEIKAVQRLLDGETTKQQAFTLMRVPCLSHTVNLAVGDFLTRQYRGHKIWHELRALRSFICKRKVCRDVPSLVETRWYCLCDFFGFVARHTDDITARISEADQRVADIFGKYDFDLISPCLEVVRALLKWTELAHAEYSNAWGIIRKAVEQLKDLHDSGNVYAGDLMEALVKRLEKTGKMGRLIFAYVTTDEGRKWYQGLPLDSRSIPVGQLQFECKKYIDRQAVREFAFFAKYLSTSPAILKAFWRDYVRPDSPFQFKRTDMTIDFWIRIRALEVTYPGLGAVSLQAAADMGIILAIMPVSESSVERQFSHIRYLFGTRAQHMSADLLDARIVMQLNDVRRDKSWDLVLDVLEMVDAEAGPGQPPADNVFLVPVPEREHVARPHFGGAQTFSMVDGVRRPIL